MTQLHLINIYIDKNCVNFDTYRDEINAVQLMFNNKYCDVDGNYLHIRVFDEYGDNTFLPYKNNIVVFSNRNIISHIDAKIISHNTFVSDIVYIMLCIQNNINEYVLLHRFKEIK